MRYLLLIFSLTLLFACNRHEHKPIGPQSLTFELDTIQKEAKLENGETYLEFYVEDLRLQTQGDSTLEKIKGQIHRHLIEGNLNTVQDIETYESLFDSITAEYQRLLITDYAPHNSWLLGQYIKVYYNENGLFSYLSEHHSYTGGAHPHTYQSSQLIQLSNGEILKLENLIEPKDNVELQRLGESYFRNQIQANERTSLNDLGFWFENDQFYLPEAFTIDSAGIHFFYNAYDIAPYAMGEFYFLIPAETVKVLLKPEYQVLFEREKTPAS